MACISYASAASRVSNTLEHYHFEQDTCGQYLAVAHDAGGVVTPVLRILFSPVVAQTLGWVIRLADIIELARTGVSQRID